MERDQAEKLIALLERIAVALEALAKGEEITVSKSEEQRIAEANLFLEKARGMFDGISEVFAENEKRKADHRAHNAELLRTGNYLKYNTPIPIDEDDS